MRVLVAIAGLAVGAMVAGLILLVDPLALFESAVAEPVDEPAQLLVDGELARGITPDPLGVMGFDEGQRAPFAESSLRHSRLQVSILKSASGGAPALAVKLAATDADNSLLRGRLLTDNAWNLMWPGHGSLFLAGRDDYRPMLADEAAKLLQGKNFEASPEPRPIVVAPRLLGGGGRLRSVTGTYREFRSPASPGEIVLGLTEK